MLLSYHYRDYLFTAAYHYLLVYRQSEHLSRQSVIVSVLSAACHNVFALFCYVLARGFGLEFIFPHGERVIRGGDSVGGSSKRHTLPWSKSVLDIVQWITNARVFVMYKDLGCALAFEEVGPKTITRQSCSMHAASDRQDNHLFFDTDSKPIKVDNRTRLHQV
jgi:hypothetical protein